MITIVVVFLVLAVFILSAPVKAIIRYKQKKLYFDVYLYGFKVYKGKKKGDKNTSDVAGFEKDTLSLTEKLKNFKKSYSKITALLKKYTKIEIIRLDVVVGTGDAATTAISAGSLWATIYALVGIIGKIIFIDEHKVTVNPDYVNTVFQADGECIIKSRFVYIIIIACNFFNKNPKKGKEE